eukprot:CAMPEP_0180823682 /NCGR_PEP_ID=MMETSP1038_2-20121128/72034_1 /TAXON_ID=632150 /ORGANISM="Azadinium spinosum, Strain 3D9" /LENGTH=118 /DNA_ID=CAMNT_0022866027 /DNA_START=1 /DNA_END=354 /DNA_ORIENTATION=+
MAAFKAPAKVKMDFNKRRLGDMEETRHKSKEGKAGISDWVQPEASQQWETEKSESSWGSHTVASKGRDTGDSHATFPLLKAQSADGCLWYGVPFSASEEVSQHRETGLHTEASKGRDT